MEHKGLLFYPHIWFARFNLTTCIDLWCCTVYPTKSQTRTKLKWQFNKLSLCTIVNITRRSVQFPSDKGRETMKLSSQKTQLEKHYSIEKANCHVGPFSRIKVEKNSPKSSCQLTLIDTILSASICFFSWSILVDKFPTASFAGSPCGFCQHMQ